MSWVRLHDGWNRHPKFAGLNRSARLLWVDLLTYCREHLTDGVLTRDTIFLAAIDCPKQTVTKHVSELVRRGLLDLIDEATAKRIAKEGIERVVEGGLQVDRRSGGSSMEGPWLLHDYLDWSDPKASVLNARAKTNARVAKHRKLKAASEEPRKGNGGCNGVTNEDVTSNSHDGVTASQPNPTQPLPDPPCSPPAGGDGQPDLFGAAGPEDIPPPPSAKAKSRRTKPAESSGYPEVVDHWFKLFERIRGTKPPFDDLEGKAVKKLLDTFRGDVRAISDAIDNAMADEWWSRNRASLHELAKNPQQFVGRVPSARTRDSPAPRASRIQPPTGVQFQTADVERL